MTEVRNQHLSSLLEGMTTCVLTVDADWNIRYANRSARQVLGQESSASDATFEGSPLWDIYHPAEGNGAAALRSVMEQRAPTHYRSFYPELNLWLTVQAEPWDRGGIALFLNDVSEQTRLQHELQLHALRDQRIEILARLSGELAHEIKNPLAIIHARASDLADLCSEADTLPSAAVASSCSSILKTSDRAMRILRGLAALAREGRDDPMQRADIRTIVDETIELVEPRCRTHGIRLDRILPPELPMVECREVQIGQVVMNLLNNAFDAVNLSATADRWVRVEVSVDGPEGDPSGQSLIVDVLDGGPGVPAHARGNLMQSFYTTKPVGAGIGIGLSVCRSIAEDHHGKLELLEQERPTCFRLTIPVQSPREDVAYDPE